MACSISVLIHDASGRSGSDRADIKRNSADKNGMLSGLVNLLESIGSGNCPSQVDLDISSSGLAAASGTVTCASVSAADTVTINGVVFTAVNGGTPGANEFDMSGTDTADATSLAAAINASVSSLVQGYVSASSSGAVVTISSVYKGLMGNTHTLASSNGTRLAVSGARLAGGTGAVSTSGKTNYSFGG